MNDNPHFGVVPIDNPTLPSGQDKVNNIKRYGFSGRTAVWPANAAIHLKIIEIDRIANLSHCHRDINCSWRGPRVYQSTSDGTPDLIDEIITKARSSHFHIAIYHCISLGTVVTRRLIWTTGGQPNRA